jgi:hypothetical protein
MRQFRFSSESYIPQLCFLSNIHVKLVMHFSLENIRQKLFVPVEVVSSPYGSFDTLGKFLSNSILALQKP